MKTIDIAWKDLKHIFKSVVALIMMFGAPLLIAGLLYFAFGSLGGASDGKAAYNLPVTRVELVNLDRPTAPSGFSAGELLSNFLQDPSLAEVISVHLAADEAAARQAVDAQRAGVAVIIPADFSQAATTPGRTANVAIYADPTLTIGPGIVKDLVSHFMDAFSGARIAGQVAGGGQLVAAGQADPARQQVVIQKYAAWVQSSGHGEGAAAPRLAIISPAGEAQSKSQAAPMIGPIMAGMLVFFVFFMGANGAESIIKEDGLGTSARLFGTPTPIAAVLGGKFLGILLSLRLQAALLLLASALLFGISWGRPLVVLLVSLGLVVAAAGFGVMLMSFVKNSRQTGPVMGGVMMLLGLLGGLLTTGIPNMPAGFERVTRFTPTGWALHGWKLALAGGTAAQALPPVFVLLAMGAAFLAVGIVQFRKRFA